MLSPPWAHEVEVVISLTSEFAVHFIRAYLKTPISSTLHHFYIHILPPLLNYKKYEGSSNIHFWQTRMSWSIDI